MSDRELTMDDYLAMVRRRLKVILIPALIAPVTGFLISYVLPPRFQAQSTVLVEGQKVPDNYVAPVITSDFAQRVQSLSQEVVTPNRLRPLLQSLGYTKPEEQAKIIGDIQQNLQVQPVITTMSQAAQASPAAHRKPSASDEPLPGFNVIYTDKDASRSQKICNAMTSAIVDENLRSRSEVAQSTTDFLSRQVGDAKTALDEQDAKLAAFKKQYLGQLPTDVDNNMRILMSLNSQLDATTQTLNRAQQDRAYTESMLAQQIAVWKASQSATNPQSLEQQLSQLQGQLLQLQARYTDDYPDVIKTKADIAEVQKKLKEVKAAAAAGSADTSDKANAEEPPEIRQLRLQIHQYQEVIEQSAADQKKLQAQINVYQSRTAMSPNVEEQFKLLTRDNDNAQAFYKDLLAKKSAAGLGTSMENQQEGEQMQIAATASLPEDPNFPNRVLCAEVGSFTGLAVGIGLAIWRRFRPPVSPSDVSISNEVNPPTDATDAPITSAAPHRWFFRRSTKN